MLMRRGTPRVAVPSCGPFATVALGSAVYDQGGQWPVDDGAYLLAQGTMLVSQAPGFLPNGVGAARLTTILSPGMGCRSPRAAQRAEIL